MLGRGPAAPGRARQPRGGSVAPGRARCPGKGGSVARVSRGERARRAPGPNLRLPPPASLSQGKKEPRRSPCERQASPGAPALPPSRAGRCLPPVTMTVRDSGCRDGSPQPPSQQLSSMGAAIFSAAPAGERGAAAPHGGAREGPGGPGAAPGGARGPPGLLLPETRGDSPGRPIH